MNRKFVRQVTVQTTGTVLGGLVLYGLAAIGGLVTVHPQQALIIGLIISLTLWGAIVGYRAGPPAAHRRQDDRLPWFLQAGRREILIGACLAGILGIAVYNIGTRTRPPPTPRHTNPRHCSAATCRR